MGIQKKLVCIQILFGTIISKKKVGGGGSSVLPLRRLKREK